MKTICVDWNSAASIERQIRVLSARKRELENGGNGAIVVVKKGQKFAACRDIWETDISAIYLDMRLNEKPDFYVYAHLNPLESIDLTRACDAFAATLGMPSLPFYVGKGTKNRDANTSRNETHRKIVQKLAAVDLEPQVFRIAIGLTESQALQSESKLIDIFGLVTNGGMLCNLDEGYRSIERRMLYRQALRKLCRTPGDYERVQKELFRPEVDRMVAQPAAGRERYRGRKGGSMPWRIGK